MKYGYFAEIMGTITQIPISILSLGSAKPSSLRAKFEQLAKVNEEESKKKVEEERARRRAREAEEKNHSTQKEVFILHYLSVFPYSYIHTVIGKYLIDIEV